MLMKNLICLTLIATVANCYRPQYQQQESNSGIKGRNGHNIKSYGGYFQDTNGQNQAANDYVQTQNYHQPSVLPYQPYGWNFNQPSRTYGKYS